MNDEERAAREWLESIRWPAGPVCTHCGEAKKIYRLRPRGSRGPRPGLWKCGHCRKQFTVTVNTIFEETRLALSLWLRAIQLECAAPAGVTARNLAGLLGVTTKTSRGILKKIRYAVAERWPAARARDSILDARTQHGRRSLYPLSFEESVGLLLSVQPAWKHPEALARRLAEIEAAQRKRELTRQ